MATLKDIGVSPGINILSAFIFFVTFSILRLQPLNDRVYFLKWYLKALRTDPVYGGSFVKKVVNLDWRSYIRFLNWIPAALRMSEPELIDHAGLDSIVYLRIYLLGLKIFVPIAFLAWAILVPINWTSTGLEIVGVKNITSSDIDKLSISNVQHGFKRFWSHIVAAYTFTFWTCYILMEEYGKVAAMRLQFLATEKRRPDQFSIEYPDTQITEKHRATLLEFGKTLDGKTTIAMALTVGIPAAVGALLLLTNKIQTRGVLRPIIPEVYTLALDIIQAYGIKLIEKNE